MPTPESAVTMDLTKWIVSLGCGLVLYSRNAVAFLCIFGGCISALIVKILKRVIKQPRPHQPDNEEYGMPSSHAASVFFFATAVAIYQPRVAAVIVWVYLNRQHSIAQLVAGCLLGTINCGLTAAAVHRNTAAVAEFDAFLKSAQGAGLSLLLGCAAAWIVFRKEMRRWLKM